MNTELVKESIEFMKLSRARNIKYMDPVKNLGFSIETLKHWDKLYDFIIKTLEDKLN
jgi:hypothetical protein